MSKKYGLIVSGSKKDIRPQPKADFTKPSIFGSDSDSDDVAPVRKTTLTIGPGNNEKRQAKRIQEKALEEDPTIFQYDELYDEIESKRDQAKNEKIKESRKPKYINRLLQVAEQRKIEHERRLERMIQKERELEGEQFKDKESFVTSAYRKKLEELRKAEEREKREEYLETIGDVTKQQNLDGFYRHLYEQKLGAKDDDERPINKEETLDKSHDTEVKQSSNKFKSAKSRAYRKRQSSVEDETVKSPETKELPLKKAHLQSNIDADSDFSIDSSSSEDNENDDKTESNHPTATTREAITIKKEPDDDFKVPASVNDENKDVTQADEENGQKIQNQSIKNESNDEKTEETPKVKIDIWKKRTVGEVLEAALQRYYERKAARNG